ncbi:MAG: AarF/ABC1/UbiB kinase family protein [Candidatus Competibacteraceae bacterium]|nr:AarF/ABC1/UbiB kinase family protein [Candidatus Competibacteraceae bacterium]
MPTSRLGRLFNFGLLLGDFALSSAATSLQGLLQGKPGNAFEVLFNPRNGEKLAKRFSHLRGAAMKMGQLLSMESADLLPPAFTQALALLRSDANPMPLSQLRRLLGREYGKGWQNRFSEFDFEPLAAASIGQVHRARTIDGRDLALKIQYPGVARSIDSDVNNVALLLRLANVLPVDLDVAGLIAEAKRQLRQEADYLQEAGFLEHYRDLVADDPCLHLPCVHADFTTKQHPGHGFRRGRAAGGAD